MRQFATEKGAKAIYLAIAELNGFKQGTEASKLNFGQQCYYTSKLHDLDFTNEDDRSEAHENIWLTRLYNELDAYYQLGTTANIVKNWLVSGKRDPKWLESRASAIHKWSTPIELDASASMLQYIGVLLGDSRLCTMTNLVGDALSDPWAFEGIPRTQFKHAATPMLYGSSKACHELWQNKGYKYTIDQVKAFNNELANGAYGLANAFKEFIITNVKPRPNMQVTIANETFDIECNRFRNVGEQTKLYSIFDTQTNAIRTIHHTTTKRVPDLDQFRRYFVTLLIHNLDSQVANTVIGKTIEKYGWGIDIHDAFLVNPEAAEDVRIWYAEELDNIYANRTTILANYFASIGIGPEAQSKWERVKAMVQPLSAFKCRTMALK